MIAKTNTGVRFFDERYGGVFRGRAVLVTGREGSGKSVFGMQFVAEGLRRSERCLYLSGRPAADVVISAASIGFDFADAIDQGNLIVLEYSDYVPGRDQEHKMVLPTEGFVQLQEIIDSNAVVRVVLDTALPWVVVPSADHLSEHVFSFVRSFDRLGCTTVLTLPKPLSALAHKLRNAMEDVAPVSVTLNYDPGSGARTWILNKYLGEQKLGAGVDFTFQPNSGIVAASELPPPAAPLIAPPVSTAATPQTPPSAGPGVPGRVRFSNVVFNHTPETAPRTGATGGRGFRWDTAIGRK
jgi:KaiC/GvpD/RAD55 family RecA-like ATPase